MAKQNRGQTPSKPGSDSGPGKNRETRGQSPTTPGSDPRPGSDPNALGGKLARLGIAREEDLVLHLPLRYEDHTRLTPLRDVKAGETLQTEGRVVNVDIQYRPRRQLVCLLEDDAGGEARGRLVLRFFSFYPSQQKALALGARVRVFGDVREGYFGPEIVHPQFRVVHDDTPLADRLTPVYPTTAGLGQETLRKVVARALAADPARLADTLPEEVVRRRKLWKFGDAVAFLHAPPPRLAAITQKALDARTHPAWTRLKFDELCAQQLSLKAHRAARAKRNAPVLTGTGALARQLLDRVGFKLTRAQERVVREI
jgi:ATP-dependent DNA helicase RecG